MTTSAFTPSPGQVALVERGAPDATEMTGLVGAGDGQRFEIDLGLDADVPDGSDAIVVSVCAPDALYRLKAKSSPGASRGVIVVSDIEGLEKIQRRSAVRVPIRLGVSLACLDEPTSEIGSVVGFTIDVGVGGVQVQTLRPLPPGDPTVVLTLPDGTTVAALALVLQSSREDDGYRSRLAFQNLPADAMTSLSNLIKAYVPPA